jgi:glyoxylase-like metal-dependent hydrolase (beta-lactamase superfamily II)
MSAIPEQDVREHDVRHLGVPNVICCFQTGDVIVDPGPESSLGNLLPQLESEPKAILLTHIHLDHASATGALVRRWPHVEVWVHERGAPHLIDPSKLIASATRLYGEMMGVLWGEILPVPEENVRVLSGGESIDDYEIAYTPGHAWHHVSYLHRPSGTAFTGDVGGVRILGGPVLAPTPPPDIDIDAWQRSIDVLEDWQPASLAVTHFGRYHDPEKQLATLRERLRSWDELAARLDAAGFEQEVLKMIESETDAETARAYIQGMPPAHLHAGLARWHRKRDEKMLG